MKLNFLFGAALSFCTGLLYAQEAPIESVSPLRNPERGYHVECNYFVHNFVNPFDASEKYPETFIDNRLERCQAEGDSLTLTQLYLYLSDYVDRDLPPEAFDHMQTIFDDVKTHGFKVILRFA